MTCANSLTGSRPHEVTHRTLYVIVCAAPPAREVQTLVDLAQPTGWDVCVIATPAATRFIDAPALEARTRHAVRSDYKRLGEPDVLPPPDAIIVAPATFNTINKWAAGISDTLALGLLTEAIGKGLPVVALPFLNEAKARHPVFETSVERLRQCGVTVLYGGDIPAPHPPGAEKDRASSFPWHMALAALD
jgi:phosphopantothenoylcysteine synthetase/decarboxylase